MVHIVYSSRENEDCPGHPIYFRGDRLWLETICRTRLGTIRTSEVWWCCSQLLYQAGCQCYNWAWICTSVIEAWDCDPSVQGRWQRSFRNQQLPWHHVITSPSQSVGVSDPWMAEWCCGWEWVTAYKSDSVQKNISSAEAILSTLEIVSKYCKKMISCTCVSMTFKEPLTLSSTQ